MTRTDAPRFYSPEAATAQIVSCNDGHEQSREAAQLFGQLQYATWGCCYCGYSHRERRFIFDAYKLGLKAGRTA